MWNLSLVGDSLQSLCEETQTVSAADPAQTQDRKSSTTGLHFFKIKHLWPHLCSHNFSLLEPVKATPLKRKIKCTAGVSRLLRDHSAQPVLERLLRLTQRQLLRSDVLKHWKTSAEMLRGQAASLFLRSNMWVFLLYGPHGCWGSCCVVRHCLLQHTAWTRQRVIFFCFFEPPHLWNSPHPFDLWHIQVDEVTARVQACFSTHSHLPFRLTCFTSFTHHVEGSTAALRLHPSCCVVQFLS